MSDLSKVVWQNLWLAIGKLPISTALILPCLIVLSIAASTSAIYHNVAACCRQAPTLWIVTEGLLRQAETKFASTA